MMAEDAIMTFQVMIGRGRNPENTISPMTAALPLPKVTIPKFDGNYLQWQQFHDLFKKMIHESIIPIIHKMWYLKTNLHGEAERLIRHLSLTENNYATAWKMLQERYSNKKSALQHFYSKIVGLHIRI